MNYLLIMLKALYLYIVFLIYSDPVLFHPVLLKVIRITIHPVLLQRRKHLHLRKLRKSPAQEIESFQDIRQLHQQHHDLHVLVVV